MAAGLAGLSGTGVALNALLERTPGWGLGKTLPSGDIRLSSNENPLGLAPAAREAVVGAIVDANRYPGNYRGPLMEELAVQALQGPNTPLIIAQPTFEDISDYQDTMPFEVEAIPLTADLQHDIGRMREAASKRPSVVYICNPNNPTGTVTSSNDIDAWIADAPETTTFLLDEAYLEYVTDDRFWPALKWIDEKPNVVVIRTFSKIFAMAGLRVGYAVSHPSTARRLDEHTVQNNPNVLSGAAAVASLKDEGLVERSIAVNEESKAIVHQTCDELGLEYLPTNTNFIMHRIKGDLGTYRTRMAEAGLLVGRDFPPMLEYNRLSFGLPEEMDRWAETVKAFRKKGWI
jgi:histidinol-phosphate aminotransferase